MTTSNQNLIALPSGTRVGKYHLLRFLAKGGFGLTYEAVDPRIGLKVAIKELLPDGIAARASGNTVVPQTGSLEDDFEWAKQRFEEEAMNLASLTHPNVVRVLGIEDANGTVYMVMEYVEGRSLAEALKERGPLPEDQVRGILNGLSAGLEYVHEKGLLHRDVKPGNIILRAGRNEPVLLDFGSARQDLRKSLPMTAVVSHGYSPKEQYTISGRNQGPWTDVYALAATAYSMCRPGGEPPRDAMERDESPEAPGWVRREIGSGFSAELAGLIERGMILPAKERPQTVREWRGDSQAMAVRSEKHVDQTTAKRTLGREKSGSLMSRWAGWSALFAILVVLMAMLSLRNSTTPPDPSGVIADVDHIDEPFEVNRESDKAESAEPSSSGGFVVQSAPPTPDSSAVLERPVEPLAQTPALLTEGTQAGEVRVIGGFEMVWCPAGEASFAEKWSDEDKTFQIRIEQGYWLAKRECTRGQWYARNGDNLDGFSERSLPIDNLSWNEVSQWIGEMNEKSPPADGWIWSLPTEKQWKYAFLTGRDEPTSPEDLDGIAWYADNSGGGVKPSGSKAPNAWGFHDLLGNVWEWTDDLHKPDGPGRGTMAMINGGSFASSREACTLEGMHGQYVGTPQGGFRLALVRIDPTRSGVEESEGELQGRPGLEGGLITRDSAPDVAITTPVTEGGIEGEVKTVAGIEMVWCPPGQFMMGSPSNEKGRSSDETQHRITLTKGFWMATTECTQIQWENVMGINPSGFKGVGLPVEQVSWDDVQVWLKRMNELHPLQEGWEWALPTEAQWEYACRASTTTPFHHGSTMNGLEANCDGSLPYGTREKGPNLEATARVGSYLANDWGLHDMHGNLGEWCLDWYGQYPDGEATDPEGALGGSVRLARGGSWFNHPENCRSAYRFGYKPSEKYQNVGFRPVAVSISN